MKFLEYCAKFVQDKVLSPNLLRILSEFKGISFYSPKPLGNHRFSDDFMESRSQFDYIRLIWETKFSDDL